MSFFRYKSSRNRACGWKRFVKFFTGKRLNIMMYANVLISGEKLVVSKHFLYRSPPRTCAIVDMIGGVLLSYEREDSGITGLI